LYDSEGAVVFSQELREEKREATEIEVFDVSTEMSREEVSSTVSTKSTTAETMSSVEDVLLQTDTGMPTGVRKENDTTAVEEERPARRRNQTAEQVPEISQDGVPSYSTMTVPQLQVSTLILSTEFQNEVRKFGFKASKDKVVMIKLLEECWRAANKRPPTQQESAIQEDIESPVDDVRPDVSSPALLSRLHTRISQTIKSDPDQNVYLGILRYEPLVIEDLMDWLEEREITVSDTVIRGWCDKEGICCITRESLVGGKRARY
jgi:hypothetical protein